MGWDAEDAEDAYWADPGGAEREADAEEPRDHAADARYLREIGYWGMTPEQRAGYANEVLVEHANRAHWTERGKILNDESPTEGPEMDMYGEDFYGPQDARREYESQRVDADRAARTEHLNAMEALGKARRARMAANDERIRKGAVEARERNRAARRVELESRLAMSPGPYGVGDPRLFRVGPLAQLPDLGDPTYLGAPGTEPVQETSHGGGHAEPPRFQAGDIAERDRVNALHNRLRAVAGGWGVGLDPTLEPKATTAELQRVQDWAASRLEHLGRFPAEPDLTDGPCVVSFTRTFGGRAYTYAALRVPVGTVAGKWVVTGPKSPAYLSWADLMLWIEKGTPSGQSIVIAVADKWVLES